MLFTLMVSQSSPTIFECTYALHFLHTVHSTLRFLCPKPWVRRMQASEGARCIPARQLAPPTPRPRTTAAVARRLIGNALGVSAAVRDKAGETQLAAARKEKVAARVRRQEGLEKAWGDDDEGV